MSKIELSQQQGQAMKAIEEWSKDKNGPQVFRLFGYAGTGKTTLAKTVAEKFDTVLFGAFTGKAAQVMKTKGCSDAQTIHSMIYDVEETESGEPIFHRKHKDEADVTDADVVCIDECSMVDDDLAKDLLSFGTKILVLGDPAQLPPVKGAGYFTEAEPDFMLTEVHRQARDNPIISSSKGPRKGLFCSKAPSGADIVQIALAGPLWGSSGVISGVSPLRFCAVRLLGSKTRHRWRCLGRQGRPCRRHR